MKSGGPLANVSSLLSMSDREIAKELQLSIAALRSLDGPGCPRYLRLALAALVAGIDVDSILRGPVSSVCSPASPRDQPLNASPKHRVVPSHASLMDRPFDY